MRHNKKGLGFGVLLVLMAVMLFAYTSFREKPVEGAKAVTIQVVNDVKDCVTYTLNTDAQYLQQAMDEAEGLTYEFVDGPYGASVHTVNGLRADYEKDKVYWSFYVNDGYCNYGISQQPVEDGDAFRIEYTLA